MKTNGRKSKNLIDLRDFEDQKSYIMKRAMAKDRQLNAGMSSDTLREPTPLKNMNKLNDKPFFKHTIKDN